MKAIENKSSTFLPKLLPLTGNQIQFTSKNFLINRLYHLFYEKFNEHMPFHVNSL